MPLPIIPLEGKRAFAGIIARSLQQAGLACRVRLFANDYLPETDSQVADFVEPTFAGYSPLPLLLPTIGGPDVFGNYFIKWQTTVWTATGLGLPAAVYGFWVDAVDPWDSVRRVLWAQRFTTPQALIAAGNEIRFDLSLGSKQC